VTTDPVGLIAGNRSLPFLFAREARRLGQRVVAIGFEGETDPLLAAEVDQIHWIRVGQLGRMIRLLRDSGIRQCVMLGQVAPSHLMDLRPDLRAMSLLWKLKERNAHTLFGGIARELAADGITLVSSVPWMARHMPGPGFHLGPSLDRQEREDVEWGLRLAKEVARLEIGQCIVVRRGTVLAVEGFEGTDACLERGGRLAGRKGGAVAIKVAKWRHDERFDLPTMGARTVQTCVDWGVRVLAVEAGMTLLVEEEEVRDLVRRHSVTVVAVTAPSADGDVPDRP
jgi:DUF1009 family protein